MEQHAEVCKMKTEFCPKCETLFYPNNGDKMEDHDCMKILLERFQKGQE